MPKAELAPPRASSRRNLLAGRWPLAFREPTPLRGIDWAFTLYFGSALALALGATGWAYRFPATSQFLAGGAMLAAMGALGVCVVALRKMWQTTVRARARDPRQHVALLARGFGVYFILLHLVLVVAALLATGLTITLWGWGQGPLSTTAGFLTVAALAALGALTALGERDLALLGWFCDLSGWPGFSRSLSTTWIMATRLDAGFSRDATRERSLRLVPRLLRACTTDGRSTQIFSPADAADRELWANGVPRDLRRRTRQELAARLRGSLLPFLWGLLLGWLLLTLLHSVSGWRPPERTHPPISSPLLNPPAAKSPAENKSPQPQDKNSPVQNHSGSDGFDAKKGGEKGGGGSSANSAGGASNAQGKGESSSSKSFQSSDGGGRSDGSGGSSSPGQNSAAGKGNSGSSAPGDQGKNAEGQKGGASGNEGSQGAGDSSSQSGAQASGSANGAGKESRAEKGSSGDSGSLGNGAASKNSNAGRQKDSAPSGDSRGGNAPSSAGKGGAKESFGKEANGSPGSSGAPPKAEAADASPGNDRQSETEKTGGEGRSSSQGNGTASGKAPGNASKSGPASANGSGDAAGDPKAEAKQKEPGGGKGSSGQSDPSTHGQSGRGTSPVAEGALSPPGALPGGVDLPPSTPSGPRPLDAVQEVILDFPSETVTGGPSDFSGASRAQPGPTPPFGAASSTGKSPPAVKRDSPDSPLQTTPNWIHERLRPASERKP